MKSCPTLEGVVVVDCYGPSPEVTLVVRDVLFGELPTDRLKLIVYDIEHPERFPIGPRQAVLANPTRWHSLVRYHLLARTSSGELAVPVATDDDLPSLPCSAERLLKVVPLQFRAPGPRRRLDEYSEGEREALKANPHVRLKGDFVYFTQGVTITAIREARIAMLSHDEFAPCTRK